MMKLNTYRLGSCVMVQYPRGAFGHWRAQGEQLLADAQADPDPNDTGRYAWDQERAHRNLLSCNPAITLERLQAASGRTVAVYEVGLSYGGPEEGGWWFRTGTLLWQRRFRTLKARNRFLRTKVLPAFLGHRAWQTDIGQTNSDGEHECWITDGPAAPGFPEFRPHYE